MKKSDVYAAIRTNNYRLAIDLLVSEVHDESITKADAVVSLFAPYATKPQEHFLLLTLDGAHKPLRLHEVTRGLVNRTIVHPREVLRPAILDNAAAIIVCHNHPSGVVEPSPEDRDLTSRLTEAATLIGIPLLDHIIIGRRLGALSWYSFQEHGIL